MGIRMACVPFVNLVEWKYWKRRRRVRWAKITIIYNLRNVYHTKDIQPWSESLKSVQVWVMSKLCSTRTLSAFPCYGCLRISSSWTCEDDCRPILDSGAENMLALDSSSESPRPWWLISVQLKILNSLMDFSQLDRIVLVGQNRDWGKIRSSFVLLGIFSLRLPR